MRPVIDTDTLIKDFVNLFKGDLIGHGICREVFNCKIDTSIVIKIEKYARDFQNVLEWDTWREVQGTEYEKYFAPCIDISPCGTVLLQKKCEKPHINDYPEALPSFMNHDTKYQNFGLYEGRLVLIDYGHRRITDHINCDVTKIEWRNN